MSGDRELVEWAAKAAGWVSWDWLAGDGVLNVYDADGRHEQFNPSNDDGDALRLAVKLGLTVSAGGGGPRDPQKTNVRVWVFGTLAVIEPKGFDTAAATRRAIVRAAAQIGKAMP